MPLRNCRLPRRPSGQPMTDQQPGCIYLHIGPPKTATTSLQYVLRANDKDAGYVYGGVTQPRDPDKAELSMRLHCYCVAPDHEKLQSLRNEIDGILDSGRDLVISEEMFLVDGHVTHQEKLHRLEKVFRGVRVVVLICVRDPVVGLQSLYQELAPILGLCQRLHFSSFLLGNQAKIFDFDHVRQAASTLGEARLLSFDALTRGELRLSDLIGPRYAGLGSIELPRENQGCVSGSALRQIDAVDLVQVLPERRLLPMQMTARLKNNQLIARAWSKLLRMEVLPHRARELVVPEPEARDLREKARRALM